MKKRKRIFTTLMITAMLMMNLGACGSKDAPVNSMNSTIDDPNTTKAPATPTVKPDMDETPSPTTTPEDGVVDSGKLDVDVPTSEPNGGGDALVSSSGDHYDYTKHFPDGIEAWTDLYPFVDNSNMARHYTYFKNDNGNVMSFVWDAPTTIGGNFGLSSDNMVLNIGDSKTPNYWLFAWSYGGASNESELIKSYSTDIIMGAGIGEAIIESYQVQENDEFYRVTFKETMTSGDGKNYIGFACFIDYYGETPACYQFEYYVEESIYNEDEALAVINSITRFNLEEYESETTRND